MRKGVSFATSPAVRRRMQAQARRETGPELALRKELHRLGLRYRVHQRPVLTLRRRVDVVFRPARVAVEIRGCFWHGCARHWSTPRANAEWWEQKIARNRARDRITARRLGAAGWRLLTVWEHEDPKVAARRVATAVHVATRFTAKAPR